MVESEQLPVDAVWHLLDGASLLVTRARLLCGDPAESRPDTQLIYQAEDAVREAKRVRYRLNARREQ